MPSSRNIAPPGDRAPLAFVYDRCTSRGVRARDELDMRLTGCHTYADGMGWVLASRWVDLGAEAMRTERPQLAVLLDAMRKERGRREVLCLVHTWGRLATDDTHRQLLQRRIVEAGGWTCTTFGESDHHSARAALVDRLA
ncbi:recombinase family protein [Streptomyces sp. NPDC048197]|uniref:recombinase family protein n=1 Tax=Streptomyces sp. NPDC048197 TaxID=3365511 RepID=UPI003718DE4F